MLAVAVTAYASSVRANIPIYGEEAERAWDGDVAASFHMMARGVSEGMEGGAPVTVKVPRPPPPRTIDLPMLGSVAPHAPSGTLRFEASCASVRATHTLSSGIVIQDIADGVRGCLVFGATPVYSRSFGYAYELGGVLRLQGGKGVVLAGPPLELDATSPSEYRVAIGLPGLRGAAVGASTDSADVHVGLVPGPSAAEVEQAANAARAHWEFDTPHPAAWKTWYQTRFAQAGFVASRTAPPPGVSAADFTVACVPTDCSLTDGMGRVVVDLEGPRVDQADLKLSITYGISDVNVR